MGGNPPGREGRAPGGARPRVKVAAVSTAVLALVSSTADKVLEEGMAAHSSVLAWRLLWTEEPGGLQSMGSQRIRHDLVTRTTTMTK